MLAMQAQSRKFWPVDVLVVLVLGAYQGLNELIPLRSIPGLAAWKPFIWDMTSVVVIATLVPLIVRFENRFRLDSRPRLRIVVAHVAAAIVFSIVHTSVMVLLRKLIYWLAGDVYTF